MNILLFLIIILAFIVFIGIINERVFHIQSDIALIFFSLIIALLLSVFRFVFPAIRIILSRDFWRTKKLAEKI